MVVGDERFAFPFEWAGRGPRLLARPAQKKPSRAAEWHRMGRSPARVWFEGRTMGPAQWWW